MREAMAALGPLLRRQPLGAVGGLIVLALIAVAVLAPRLAPHGAKEATFAPFLPPSAEFPMGTDQIGRDVLSRVIWGARLSLYVGLVSVVFGITTGSLWGAVTAYLGGAADTGSQRVVDSLMALPPIILALALMAALGQSVNNVIIALVVLLTPTAARTVRSIALGIVASPYMESARAVGATNWRIISRHLIPNCMAGYIVLVTTNVSYAIVVEASLSFIGAGAPPDEPSWGGMLTAGIQALETAPWMVFFPGLAVSLAVFGLHLFADSIRAVTAAPPAARAAKKPRPGGILTWFDYGDPGRLDVHAESPLVVQQATAGVYSGLLHYEPDDPSKIAADLAERWTVSPDGKTYTFHLRKGVKWHDGQPFSADDVKASFDRILNKDFQSPKCGASLKPMVAAVEMVDANTVQFRLKFAAAPFLPSLASAWCRVAAKHILAKYGDLHQPEAPIGTGALKF